MTFRGMLKHAALAALVVAMSGGGGLLAQLPSVCDTDPNAVPFQATIDPNVINNLLGASDNAGGNPGDPKLVLPGLCVNHEITIVADFFSIPLGSAPFTITPSLGSIQVDMDVLGPFGLDFDGRRYRAINCNSICQVELPYVGSIFDGCQIEADIVRPVLSVLRGSALWDSTSITQIADTCVTGDCKAVSPTTFSSVDLNNFDVDLTGFGSCEVCINLPDPLPDLGCLDPCDGIDPLIALALEPLIDGMFESAFVNRKGEGLLINAFSIEILKDKGCLDIPEVMECKANQQPAAGSASLMESTGSRVANAALYLLPVVVAAGVARRMRRKKG